MASGTKRAADEPTGNRLLDALPARDRRRIVGDAELVDWEMRQLLWEQNEPIEQVAFPVRGVFSIVTEMNDGQVVELATVGPEGFLGVPVFLGATSMNARAFCQIDGTALIMAAEVFRRHSANGALRDRIQGYLHALLAQMGQSAACNRAHSVDERAARWLLQTHDRVGEDEFPMTQEFLAQMLGVRRATVNVAAGMLQKAGFITYRRGRITVVDRKGLESASCECYGIIDEEFRRLLDRQ